MEVLVELPLDHGEPLVTRAHRGELVVLPIEHLRDFTVCRTKNVASQEMKETSPESRERDDVFSFSEKLAPYQAVFDHRAQHAADDFVADAEDLSEPSLPTNAKPTTPWPDDFEHVVAGGCDAERT